MKKWRLVLVCLVAVALSGPLWIGMAVADQGTLIVTPPQAQQHPARESPLLRLEGTGQKILVRTETVAPQGTTPPVTELVANAAGWTDIMTEDFEGAFPGTTWDLDPDSPSASDPTWGTESNRKHGGSFSAWCAGTPLNPPSDYPNNTNSWMVYGPFSTSGLCDLELIFWTWYESAATTDQLYVGASIDNIHYPGFALSGISTGWDGYRIDLSDFTGQPQVWIAFVFQSDDAITGEGAYVDDVILHGTDAAPASAPVRIRPLDDSCTSDTTPDFDWAVVDGATQYQIQVDNNVGFGSPEINQNVDNPWYTPAAAMPGGVWYWRVRAENACGDGPWTSGWLFYIGAPTGTPSLLGPGDTSHTCDTTPLFQWTPCAAAEWFRIQVDNDSGFGSLEINATAGTSYLPGAALAPDKYYWRVRGENDCGNGTWSSVWEFTIDPLPAAPSGPSPLDGAIGVGLNADLDWADASAAASYDVLFGTTLPLPYVTSVSSSYYALPRLDESTHYYWKIVSWNDCGSTDGLMWDFTTAANSVPTLGTVAPSSGSGPVAATTYFTTTWSDADGWEDLKQCYFHVGATAAVVGNVTLLYNNHKDKLWLLNDTATEWLGGFAPGSANTIQNGQASLDCALTTVQGAGDTLTVKWAVQFKAGYTGAKKTGLKCKDMQKARAKAEWKGTWTIY
jgi:hypothetical protein